MRNIGEKSSQRGLVIHITGFIECERGAGPELIPLSFFLGESMLSCYTSRQLQSMGNGDIYLS